MITALKALRRNRFKTALIFMSMTVSIAAIFLISAIAGGVVSMYSSMLKNRRRYYCHSKRDRGYFFQ
ncbi:MAG: hypothetical protein M1300_01520 [Epsilonproteobacteria bacterium]|nr:hypothetical protein [Campylobacterota bacterium]